MTATVHVGREFDWYEGRVDDDAALAYALATNDPNTAYRTGAAVPPLYTSSLIERSMVEAQHLGVEPGAVAGHRAGVHAEHDVTFFGLVRPGMELRWRTTVRSIRQTPAGAMLTLDLDVTDPDGAPMVRHLWSTMFVGGTWTDPDSGPDLPDHSFPSDARERLMAEHAVVVDRDQTYRYGGVSGDRPPHSMDDEAARSEGFPRKIVQGQCTFAMCSGAVVKHAAGGDPDRLRRLACRFSRPVSPGDELVVRLHDAGRTADDLQAIAFEAEAGGRTVIKHGWAEIA